jgi:hypothetical protein
MVLKPIGQSAHTGRMKRFFPKNEPEHPYNNDRLGGEDQGRITLHHRLGPYWK